mgnify:FL=1
MPNSETKPHWSDRIKTALESGMEFAVEHPFKASVTAYAAIYLTQSALAQTGYSWADPMMSGVAAAVGVGLPAALGITGKLVQVERKKQEDRVNQIKNHYKKPVGYVDPSTEKPALSDYQVEEQSLEKAVEHLSADPEAWKVFSGFISKSDEAKQKVISILDARGQEATTAHKPEIEVIHGPSAGSA